MDKYKTLRESSGHFKEASDCAVIAHALVTRTSYEESHALLKRFGRKDREGTSFDRITKPAIESVGFKLTELKRNRQKGGSRYTPKTIGEKLKRGYYLCRVKGHIFAVVNGQVLDWTEGRQHRINHIYRVTKTRS